MFGPGMRIKDAKQMFLGFWIKLLLEGESIPLYGDGSQLRDLMFVGDCVEALLLAGADQPGACKVYNLGSEAPVSLLQLAEKVIQIFANGSFYFKPFERSLKVIDIGDYYADIRRIRSELGWFPKTTLEQGLRRTLDFYMKHNEAYLRNLL